MSAGLGTFIAIKSQSTGMTLMPCLWARRSMSPKSSRNSGWSPVVRERVAGVERSNEGAALPSPKTHSRTQLAPLEARSANAASKASGLYPRPQAQGPKSQP